MVFFKYNAPNIKIELPLENLFLKIRAQKFQFASFCTANRI